MALKSTIFKAELTVADLDRHHYADYRLTIARHPSETDERMMVRVLAFALFAAERLRFGRGLSDADEPDLIEEDLTGRITHWIEVGLPDERAVARAGGRADRVSVVAYGGQGAKLWWQGIENKLVRQKALTVIALAPEETRALAALAERAMRLAATIQEGGVMLGNGDALVTLHPQRLRGAAGG
jgi:uncharacterized protein YaeQ